MAIIGNLFLIIATLAFFGLCSPSFSKAAPGGEPKWTCISVLDKWIKANS